MGGSTYKNGDIRVMLPHPDVECHGKVFREGWKKATKGEQYDDPSTLDRLTWENLGYRLGKILGDASAPFIH